MTTLQGCAGTAATQCARTYADSLRRNALDIRHGQDSDEDSGGSFLLTAWRSPTGQSVNVAAG